MKIKIGDAVSFADHPEISGICEGQIVSDDWTNGKILVRVKVRGMSSETKRLLKNRFAANPNSDNSVLYYFDLSELTSMEQHKNDSNIRTKREISKRGF